MEPPFGLGRKLSLWCRASRPSYVLFYEICVDRTLFILTDRLRCLLRSCMLADTLKQMKSEPPRIVVLPPPSLPLKTAISASQATRRRLANVSRTYFSTTKLAHSSRTITLSASISRHTSARPSLLTSASSTPSPSHLVAAHLRRGPLFACSHSATLHRPKIELSAESIRLRRIMRGLAALRTSILPRGRRGASIQHLR